MPDTLAEDVFGFESSGSVSAFFVVSVSGLTANPTHGETAQVAERLYASAHHFSDLAPASITWQWRSSRGDIAGATEPVYVPVPGDNLETIYPVATPLGPYAPQAGPAHVVRFVAPVAIGVLPDVNFSRDTGEQTIAAAGTFAGDYLTFSVETALPGVSIDRGTGVVTVSTGSEIDGDVAVIASNSGGAAEVSFNLSITSAATVPAQMPAPTVTATGQDSLRVDLAAAPDDGGSPITSYDLRLRTGDEAWTVRKDVSNPEVLSGLLANTEYEVRAAAVNAIGRGPWSGSGSARTEKDALPAIMANADNTVDILVSDGTFTITVSGADQAHHNGTFGPLDTSALASGPLMVATPVVGGTAGTGETLTAAPGLWIFPADDAATVTGEWISGGVDTGDTDKSYLTNPGDAGDDVLYRETATNSAGSRSADSNAIGIPITATVPARMEAPTVTATGTDSIRIDLAAAPDDGGSAIMSYDLRWRENDGTWTLVTGIGDPETLKKLAASTLYNIQTRAVNAVGNGAWSISGSTSTEVANGVLFSDNFSNYEIDSDLKDTPNYTRMDGWLPIEAQDDNGIRVARQPSGTQSEILTYTGQPTAQRRKITWVYHAARIGGSPGFNVGFFAAYTDAQNYVGAEVDTGGWFTVRHVSAGKSNISKSIAPGAISEGDTVSIEIDSTVMRVKINGMEIVGPFVVPDVTLGAPGFRLNNHKDATQAPAISNFEIEEL